MSTETSMHRVVKVEQHLNTIHRGNSGRFYTLKIQATDEDGGKHTLVLYSEERFNLDITRNPKL